MKYAMPVAACVLVALIIYGAGPRVNPQRTDVMWDAPTLNEDGTPCDDLVGYELAITSQEVPDLNTGGTVLQTIPMSQTQYTLGSLTLPDGPYRFWVRAVDEAGNVSDYSDYLDLELDQTKPGKPSRPRR